jgi:hypothetical protein
VTIGVLCPTLKRRLQKPEKLTKGTVPFFQTAKNGKWGRAIANVLK